MRIFLASLLAATLVPAAFAHSPPPLHDCAAPTRPADDQNDILWQQFLDDVAAFRVCISDFVDANRAAATAHTEAARAATLDWNGFVRSGLNVPEDFPWPPEEAGRR